MRQRRRPKYMRSELRGLLNLAEGLAVLKCRSSSNLATLVRIWARPLSMVMAQGNITDLGISGAPKRRRWRFKGSKGTIAPRCQFCSYTGNILRMPSRTHCMLQTRSTWKQLDKKFGHDLEALWAEAKRVLGAFGAGKALDSLDETIAEFHTVDRRADAFRYAVDRNGQKHFKGHGTVVLYALGERRRDGLPRRCARGKSPKSKGGRHPALRARSGHAVRGRRSLRMARGGRSPLDELAEVDVPFDELAEEEVPFELLAEVDVPLPAKAAVENATAVDSRSAAMSFMVRLQ